MCLSDYSAVLTVEAMRPSKLKDHFYSQQGEKDFSFFQYNDIGLKRLKFDPL